MACVHSTNCVWLFVLQDVAQCKHEPLTCFAVNVTGTHNLLAAIAKHVAGPKVFGRRKLWSQPPPPSSLVHWKPHHFATVYISSAMVYDDPTPAEALPEAAPLQVAPTRCVLPLLDTGAHCITLKNCRARLAHMWRRLSQLRTWFGQ